MAILKHLSSKNADYGKALTYLTFEHDELTNKPLRNPDGSYIRRQEFYLDGLNCEPYTHRKSENTTILPSIAGN